MFDIGRSFRVRSDEKRSCPDLRDYLDPYAFNWNPGCGPFMRFLRSTNCLNCGLYWSLGSIGGGGEATDTSIILCKQCGRGISGIAAFSRPSPAASKTTG